MNNVSLAEEMKMLRSLAMSLVGRDTEGEYRPEFVRHILQSLKSHPAKRFVHKKSFLAELSKDA